MVRDHIGIFVKIGIIGGGIGLNNRSKALDNFDETKSPSSSGQDTLIHAKNI